MLARPTRSHRPRPTTRRGVAAAEFAVCLPMLLLLLLGMLECCTMIFLKQSLAVAAYEGAHTALSPGATDADVQTVCAGILTDRRVNGGATQILPGPLAGIAEGEYVRVQVTAATDANAILPARFFRGRQLQSTAVMMKEL
ncbi:TadE-like protein [Posidoniimonas polymericola]|uniref:TadE-like protein n=1 Tax=Posidoniimonas polymericola TaxID=2528002 RepID=A0A5C5YR73_9BACT|nr:TadE/TadG family type IV pilus assembly protein [Posidoniimonas polymericola]TWT77328.1 TadE-like protein [Posidoniimonas polymericola]